MRTTMAVEPHTPARRSTTAAASRRVPPPPPTSGLAVRPSRPAAPRASTAARGNEPSASVAAAAGATTSVMTRPSASRLVLNDGLRFGLVRPQPPLLVVSASAEKRRAAVLVARPGDGEVGSAPQHSGLLVGLARGGTLAEAGRLRQWPAIIGGRRPALPRPGAGPS